MPKQNGGQVSVGFGIESTPGTEVAPAIWTRQSKLSFQRQTETIQNNSGLGRLEEVNDSAVVASWAGGDLENKVYDQSIGYLLLNLLGSVSTSNNADASGNVKNHLFTINQTSLPPSLTIVRRDLNTNRRHGLGTCNSLTLESNSRDWVMATASLLAKRGVSGTDVASYVAENSFTSKHTTIKLATNVAGLGAASALDATAFSITIERSKADPYIPLGADGPTSFDLGRFRVSGKMTLKYRSTLYEDLWFANTAQALSVAFVNNDAVIGTSANPGLVLTLPQARLSTFSLSDDLEDDTEQTIDFTGEVSASAGYMVQALLTNMKTNYVS